MGIYHDLIIDHYKNPRNFGVLENPDAVAQEANASCGDLIEFQIKIKKIETGKSCEAGSRSAGQKTIIAEIAWRGVGCAISTAAASLLSEKIQNSEFPARHRLSPKAIAGGSIQNLMAMTDDDMVKMLGGDISPTRLKCATLSLKALKKAFKQSNAKI